MKSSILAVGTELTDGQIINRNAAWLAARLKKFGARCELHLTIPDDRASILASLRECARQSDVIFVTGGLGPTSDDFTRELVSEWAETPLEFHEPSWQWIQERLGARGYPVTEIQRQQCFFPRGSVVLHNSQGTANAFRLTAHGRKLIVLPGPPREIEAIWADHLEAYVSNLCRDADPFVTRSWDLIGLGESQVAELATPLTDGCAYEIGYRVHLPYVEFKISHSRSQTAAAEPLVRRLTETFSKWTATRDGEDLAQVLAQRLAGVRRLEIVDEVSGALLWQRLASPWATLWNESQWEIRRGGESNETADVSLILRKRSEHEARFVFRHGNQRRETWLEAPMRGSVLADRRRMYFLESALAWWAEQAKHI